jgi:hypothetical protein
MIVSFVFGLLFHTPCEYAFGVHNDGGGRLPELEKNERLGRDKCKGTGRIYNKRKREIVPPRNMSLVDSGRVLIRRIIVVTGKNFRDDARDLSHMSVI